jgi:Ca2+-binding EF-hand superfamily protein
VIRFYMVGQDATDVALRSSRGALPNGLDPKYLRQIFRSIDGDCDGQISANDLRAYLESMGESVTDSEINEMIRLADYGADGFVHLTEFSDLFRQYNVDGTENEIYKELLPESAALRTDIQSLARASTRETNEGILSRFISRLPGAIDSSAWIKRDALKNIIQRRSQLKLETVSEKSFFDLLGVPRSELGERAYDILSSHLDFLDSRTLILMLGAFVAASCEERIEFACRLLDESNTGLLVEEQVVAIVEANFVGVDTAIQPRIDTIMKESDANSILSRKKISNMAKIQPSLLFPTSRLTPPRDEYQYLK